ncbi:DNA methyltransferase [Polaromonas sp. AER18D-145]|uniref:class I SAM-dependent DNA methyltransferase n=1 Tax=Polaromonas sp. AER18D-145 TaxID=1977060 RepID=UPI000BBB7E39|nr:DNA methyltransferase [Polaromonas sp. AER18D-145]
MTPQTFITKWGPGGPAFQLNEEQGAQSHFIDLCELLAVPKPGSEAGYLFEEKNAVIGGRTGYADVFKRGAFAWENKAPGKNLDAALKQLLTYSLALSNPPILVVCDRLTIRIHTQFTGHPTETFNVALAELDQPDKLALLRRIWTDPESFRPKKTSRDITEAAAKSFATLAGQLRKAGHEPQKVSHFLTQCLFCFFAEDVGLLPNELFKKMINAKFDLPTRHGMLPSEKLTGGLATLFTSMRTGDLFGVHDIARFNGGLFKIIDVPKLDIMNVTELRNAADQNWSAIDVSIFGTLFERGLDPSKRSQLGAHYTDPATIQRIVEPVLQRPLLQIWEQTAQEIRALMAKNTRKGDKHYKAAKARFIGWLDQLSSYRVLDPACGSGNFLFLGLKTLKDIEHQSHIDAAMLGLDREADLVTGPHNMLGIELNEYAAELARVTVWIGELQWRLQHGYEFKTNPVLEPLDHIECRDALLSFLPLPPEEGSQKSPLPVGEGRGEGSPRAVEAMWPKASVVIGNPPFLGVSRKRRELGEAYTRALDEIYAPGVPGGADLVCYWFAKALKAIETNGLGAAGLVATNSIRGGANRKVLQAITERSNIYAAWSDEPWVNEGAAVRVSLISFGHDKSAQLNGVTVPQIYADLTAPTMAGDLLDVSKAHTLAENLGASFQGASKKAKFEIDAKLARDWLRLPNPHGRPNSDVLKPWANGFELSRGPQHQWIIDFGNDLAEAEAALYEKPFGYVVARIKPERVKKSEPALRDCWWRFGRPRVEMRIAFKPLTRFIATVAHSKHRSFVWLPVTTSPDQALITVARADDTTLGLLHSRFHELWSLRVGTSIGVGNDPRYTPTTCFETFPFPEGLSPADTANQATEAIDGGALIPAGLSSGSVRAELPVLSTVEGVEALPNAKNPSTGSGRTGSDVRGVAEAIARAAKRLNDLREAWLNPPEWTQRVPEVVPLGMTVSPYPDRILPKDGFEKELAERTLTKLYNQRPAWLDAAHKELDAAVAAAYGWVDYRADMPDEEILKRLLALNLERSGAA